GTVVRTNPSYSRISCPSPWLSFAAVPFPDHLKNNLSEATDNSNMLWLYTKLTAP
ncbi:hypothetical protein B0F90DRAFT_1728965, partial [Multifurca ochricompacta]